MKTYKNLYPQIYSFENLYRSFRAARKGKRDRVAVASFELDLEQNLLALSDELRYLSYGVSCRVLFFMSCLNVFTQKIVHIVLAQVCR